MKLLYDPNSLDPGYIYLPTSQKSACPAVNKPTLVSGQKFNNLFPAIQL